MSTVIGLVTEKNPSTKVVYLGCDTMASDGSISISGQNKVIELSAGETPMAIGAVGQMTFLNFLEYRLNVPEFSPTSDRDVSTYVVAQLVPYIRDGYLASSGQQGLRCPDHNTPANQLLVALCGRLFSVDEEWGVLESDLPYDAIGSGREVALGALGALDYLSINRDAAMVGIALSVSCALSVFSDIPTNIFEVEWESWS